MLVLRGKGATWNAEQTDALPPLERNVLVEDMAAWVWKMVRLPILQLLLNFVQKFKHLPISKGKHNPIII